MEKQELFTGIEKILDNWDPIGILQNVRPISYEKQSIGEYSRYVKPILDIYLSNGSVYEYLIVLHTDLRDYPDKELKKEIKCVSEQIVSFLANIIKGEWRC